MIVYLVRHGKTDYLGKKLCGNLPGIHLNEEGKWQAQKISDYLGAFPIKAIYSSPLDRACETAAPLARILGLTVLPQDFLREINFGDFQGKGEEVWSTPTWQQFTEHPAEVRFPNGESIAETQARVVKGLDRLIPQYSASERILCVAHCEVLRLAIAAVIHLPLDEYHRLTVDPASISKIEWSADKKKLHSLNYVPL